MEVSAGKYIQTQRVQSVALVIALVGQCDGCKMEMAPIALAYIYKLMIGLAPWGVGVALTC